MLGIGTDLVEVDQVRAALGRHPNLRKRLFTPAEWDYSHRYRDPMPHLAARFAAKEAAMKALGGGIGDMGFTDIEVIRSDRGKPSLVLSGRASRLAEEAGVARLEVSITHTSTMAHAMVAAL